MNKQFPEVSSTYGAPMGRREYGSMPDHGRTVRVFRVRLDSGGYDDGGAYWGRGPKPLFCATDGADYLQFVRADSRLCAVASLEIPRDALKVPPMADYLRLREKERRGVLSASGVVLRQRLDELGFAE